MIGTGTKNCIGAIEEGVFGFSRRLETGFPAEIRSRQASERSGIPKKRDKLKLSKMQSKNLKAFVFGPHRNKFLRILKNKLNVKSFRNLNEILKVIFSEINIQKSKKNIIFFSPAGASFDSFKNFEDRGYYFNQIIKKYTNANR